MASPPRACAAQSLTTGRSAGVLVGAQKALRVALEVSPASCTAEVVDLALILGRWGAFRGLHAHAANGVYVLGLRCCRSVGLIDHSRGCGPAVLHHLGQDADGNLTGSDGAEVEP